MAQNATLRTSGGITGHLRHLVPNRRHVALTIAIESGVALTGLPLPAYVSLGLALEALIELVSRYW